METGEVVVQYLLVRVLLVLGEVMVVSSVLQVRGRVVLPEAVIWRLMGE
jgi:hypothetical protein